MILILKEARLEEERQKSKNETKKRHNLTASIFSKKIADSIIPAVMHDLEESGYFVDPIQKGIDKILYLYNAGLSKSLS